MRVGDLLEKDMGNSLLYCLTRPETLEMEAGALHRLGDAIVGHPQICPTCGAGLQPKSPLEQVPDPEMRWRLVKGLVE